MAAAPAPAQPKGATGVLVLADGSIIWGKGFGAEGVAVGEVCFNTAILAIGKLGVVHFFKLVRFFFKITVFVYRIQS